MMVKEVESFFLRFQHHLRLCFLLSLCGDIESTQVEENQVLYNGHFLDLESRNAINLGI